jgi:hypothetical protein
MLNIDTYIPIVEKYKDIRFDIGDQAWELLFEFPNFDYISSYQAYSFLNATIPKVDYKNTHKRVKRLESLGLIEPVKETEIKAEDTKHGAKYYRITDAGMFYMFREGGDKVSELLPSIIEAHGNYLIFETFLYPYFKKETLLALGKAFTITEEDLGDTTVSVTKGPVVNILDMMCRYIGYCCQQMYSYIITLKAHTPKLKYQKRKALRDRMLKELLDNIELEKDHLVMKIALGFRDYRKANRPDAQGFLTLAQDEKFMKVVDDLTRDFKKSFETAMHLRTES